MRIAFYAPMKPPDHPVPSGERLMARLLMAALERAGHDAVLISRWRNHAKDPVAAVALRAGAAAERARLLAEAAAQPPFDLWFTYHPYYKCPDPLGPQISRAWGIPYVTAEASYAAKRDRDAWAPFQAELVAGLSQAALNIAMTGRDAEGLAEALPHLSLARLPPFIDIGPYVASSAGGDPQRLIAVAMMRAGDKMQSYRLLAEALARIADRPFRLTLVGDGPMRAEVEALFSGLSNGRIDWRGALDAAGVAAAYREAGLFVWPGCGEAYGLAYLEAQASGLPVVAMATAGVSEVVADGRTGRLTPHGDVEAYAAAIAALLDDPDEQRRLGAESRAFVAAERTLDAAANRLNALLNQARSSRQ